MAGGREVVKKTGDPFLWCDVGHHPGKLGCAGGLDFPVVLRSTIIMRVTADEEDWYIATPKDLYAACGFFDSLGHSREMKQFVEVMGKTYADLKVRHARQLVGNTMHLVTQASWMAYVLSNLSSRKSTISTVMATSGGNETEEDEFAAAASQSTVQDDPEDQEPFLPSEDEFAAAM